MKVKLLMMIVIILSLVMVGFFTVTSMAEEVPRMAKEKLNGLLADPDVIILDVRLSKDWNTSKFKIKGAIRETKKEFSSWAHKYPKDKTLVLYCA